MTLRFLIDMFFFMETEFPVDFSSKIQKHFIGLIVSSVLISISVSSLGDCVKFERLFQSEVLASFGSILREMKLKIYFNGTNFCWKSKSKSKRKLKMHVSGSKSAFFYLSAMT